MDRLKLITISILILGLASLVPLQRWLDRQTGTRVVEEALYIPSGETLKRISFGFEGILSDIYWLRAVQYFGNTVLAGGLAVDSNERFELLYPLLDAATSLDPQYLIAYQFGGMFVADYHSSEKAIKLLERGIRENPAAWRLYQYLGMIYWRERDFVRASEAFAAGGRVPGAPDFMRAMAAQMLAEGGSRETARQLFAQVHQTAEDPHIKKATEAKLKRLDALDQIDCLAKMVQTYQAKTGQFPPSLHLRSLAASLGSALSDVRAGCRPNLQFNVTEQGLAADPEGYAYAYNSRTGAIELNPQSTIMTK